MPCAPISCIHARERMYLPNIYVYPRLYLEASPLPQKKTCPSLSATLVSLPSVVRYGYSSL